MSDPHRSTVAAESEISACLRDAPSGREKPNSECEGVLGFVTSD